MGTDTCATMRVHIYLFIQTEIRLRNIYLLIQYEIHLRNILFSMIYIFCEFVFFSLFNIMSGIISKPTASSEKLKWQAKAAFNESNYDLALELFSHVLEQVQRYAPYLTNRALCYYRLNDADKV
ncbi:unnamed protein product [Rotaria magnacalcarata]